MGELLRGPAEKAGNAIHSSGWRGCIISGLTACLCFVMNSRAGGKTESKRQG